MPFVLAQCRRCDAFLEVDTTVKRATCLHCGALYVMEEPINNINFNITGAYGDAVASSTAITLEMKMKLDAAEASLKLGKYDDALMKFRALSDDIPQDYRVWWGQIRAISKEFTRSIEDRATLDELHELYHAMTLFLPPQKRVELERRFRDYISAQEQDLDRRKYDLASRAEELDAEYAELQERMEKCQRETYLSAGQIAEYRVIVLVSLVVLGVILGSVFWFGAALCGCLAYVSAIEPELMQRAEQQEEEIKTTIRECTARCHAIEQELDAIEKQMAKLLV